MKKIISNKVYDTATAKEVGYWSNDLPQSDFQYMEEYLFVKRTGEYFIFGRGGAQTKYANDCGDGSWNAGERIIPISYEAAQQWAEKHLDSEDYEKAFGAVREDESRTTVTISLSVGAIERGKRAAKQAGMSFSAYIESKL